MPRVTRTQLPKATAARPSARKSKAPSEARAQYSHDEIAKRAYDLFVRDGAVHGRDKDHWLMAEREVLGVPPTALSESTSPEARPCRAGVAMPVG